MSRRPPAADVAIAVVIAALILVVSPGVAIAALIGIIVIIGCGVSRALERRSGRSRRSSGRRVTRRR